MSKMTSTYEIREYTDFDYFKGNDHDLIYTGIYSSYHSSCPQ